MSTRVSKVAVLLAAFNGREWIAEQVDSILSQQDVAVILFVSDDVSTDGTLGWLKKTARSDPRIQVLPQVGRMGSAGQNFYRLIRDVDTSGFDFIALADQDDIWNPDKLISHIKLLKQNNAEAVSSNVMAFWPDGRRKLINKSQTQRRYDFLFESAGPGCTFLMTPWLVNEVRFELETSEVARDVEMHDWLIYAICRAHGRLWVIDPAPSMLYRQHQANVMGANAGLKAVLARLVKIKSGWYRGEVAKVARVVTGINSEAGLATLADLVEHESLLARLRLLSYVSQARRKGLDRLVLGLSILFFMF